MRSILPNTTTTNYPFGMLMDGRTFSSEAYGYGFNGMQKDDEIKGSGNSYTTEFREYEPRIAKWLSLDPVTHHQYSPYSAYDNNPIYYIDPLGADCENESKDDLNDDTKVETVKKNTEIIIPSSTVEDPKRVSKSKLGIDESKTAEKNMPALIDKMKPGEYLDGDDLGFIEDKVGYAVDKLVKISNNKFKIVPTFFGQTVIPIGTTATIEKGESTILIKVDGKNVATKVTGYWITLSGVKIDGQSKVFLSGNTLYWQTPSEKDSKKTNYHYKPLGNI